MTLSAAQLVIDAVKCLFNRMVEQAAQLGYNVPDGRCALELLCTWLVEDMFLCSSTLQYVHTTRL